MEKITKAKSQITKNMINYFWFLKPKSCGSMNFYRNIMQNYINILVNNIGS